MRAFANRTSRKLHAGDWVEVRSTQEILATLDSRGTLTGLPFMPEMLAFCGKRFHVWKRADKTCSEGNGGNIRKVHDTVHLKELRCDGSTHGGCDAGCLLFWHERWLRRLEGPEPSSPLKPESSETITTECTLDTLTRATRRALASPGDSEDSFCCQSTEINSFSSPLPWWHATQYVRDLRSRNVTVLEFVAGIFIGLYNRVQHLRRGRQFRSVTGDNAKTPRAGATLSAGDLVQVKSTAEIGRTLDRRGKNCGLSFRPVMVPYCEGQYRVLRRVDKIVDPRTGKMVFLGGNCVILDGVACTGRDRRFCPRAVYWFWRDLWLSKVREPACAADELENPSRTCPVAADSPSAASVDELDLSKT